ncbi:uroporphyrinogen-III synthase [bacterium]|nr:uroporphyrinogen-III synthase [bacterium]
MTFLLTRPLGRNCDLADAIAAQGGRTLKLPMLEVNALQDASSDAVIAECLAQLDAIDIALFISTNAVHFTVEALQRHGLQWPKNLPCLGIGAATAAAIEGAGLSLLGCAEVSNSARNEDSERLLTHEALRSIDGRRVMIFKGVNGRAWLGQQLQARGAKVNYCELYRRSRPAWDADELITMLKSNDPRAVLVASGETLHNFVYYVHRIAEKSPAWGQRLLSLPIVVPSPRVANLASAAGFELVWQADNASAKANLECLRARLLS